MCMYIYTNVCVYMLVYNHQQEEIKKQLKQGMLVPLDTTPTRTIKKQTAKIESPMPYPPTLSKSDSLPPSPSLSPSLPR